MIFSHLKDYNEAIRLKPNYAEAYYNRGLIKKEGSEKQEALADFRKASEIHQQQGNTEFYNQSRDRIRELGEWGELERKKFNIEINLENLGD